LEPADHWSGFAPPSPSLCIYLVLPRVSIDERRSQLVSFGAQEAEILGGWQRAALHAASLCIGQLVVSWLLGAGRRFRQLPGGVPGARSGIELPCCRVPLHERTCDARGCLFAGGHSVGRAAHELRSFAAGVVVTLAAVWRLRLWAVGGWDVAGRFSVWTPGQDGPAPAAAAAAPPRRALPASQPNGRSLAAAAATGVVAVVSGDPPVWRPRRQ
jgi:hypothetical protein